MIVHMPLALAMIAPMVLGGLWLALRRPSASRRMWWAAVALQGLLLATGLFALRTGEADEERAEAIVSEAAIEQHEERAEVFVTVAGVVLAAALAGALVPKRLGVWLGGAATAGSLAVAALAVMVGSAGGELVYTHGAAAAYAQTPGATAGPAPGLMEDDDD